MKLIQKAIPIGVTLWLIGCGGLFVIISKRIVVSDERNLFRPEILYQKK